MTGRRTETRKMLLSAAAAGAVLLPMPVVLPPYPLIILSYALVFAIACMGLNLLFGTTGLLSFGHATFFGISAYAGAFLYRFTTGSRLSTRSNPTCWSASPARWCWPRPSASSVCARPGSISRS